MPPCPTSMAFQHQADWYTNFPRFQGAQLDHVLANVFSLPLEYGSHECKNEVD